MASTRGLRVHYHWILVAVMFLSAGLSLAACSAFSLLIVPLQKEFGWSSTTIVGAWSLGGIFFGPVAAVVGRLVDRWGARVVIPIGALLVGGGLASLSMASSVWQLYLSYGFVVAIGLAFVYPVPNVLVIQNWFVRRRGLALGLAMAGSGLVSIVLFPSAQYIISTYGWRAECVVMGGMVILVVAPLNFLLQRNRPEEMGLQAYGGHESGHDRRRALVVDHDWAGREWTLPAAAKTRRFWAIFVGGTAGVFFGDAVRVHQAAILTDAGYDTMFVASLVGVVSAASALGRMFWGWLSDRIGREQAGIIGALCVVAGLGALIGIQTGGSRMLVYAYVSLLGIGIGIVEPIFSATAADIFQGRHFGSVFGVLCISQGAGGVMGPMVIALSYDRTGGYLTGLLLTMPVVCLMAACFWMASPGAVRLVSGKVRAAVLPSEES